jgi:hypothetical protein
MLGCLGKVPPDRSQGHVTDYIIQHYQRWAYGHATDEDNDLRLRDPDTFWPDMLIGDQNMSSEQCRLHREQMGIPPIPPHRRAAAEQAPYKLTFDKRGMEMPYVPNPPQPQEEPLGSQPRRPGCERRPVVHPDNVYGSQNPTQSEQMCNREFREIIDNVPAPSGSDNRPDSLPHEGKGKERADYLVKMVQEGGAGLTNFKVFTVPYVVWSDTTRQQCLQNPIFFGEFLHYFPVIVWL